MRLTPEDRAERLRQMTAAHQAFADAVERCSAAITAFVDAWKRLPRPPRWGE